MRELSQESFMYAKQFFTVCKDRSHFSPNINADTYDVQTAY